MVFSESSHFLNGIVLSLFRRHCFGCVVDEFPQRYGAETLAHGLIGRDQLLVQHRVNISSHGTARVRVLVEMKQNGVFLYRFKHVQQRYRFRLPRK